MANRVAQNPLTDVPLSKLPNCNTNSQHLWPALISLSLQYCIYPWTLVAFPKRCAFATTVMNFWRQKVCSRLCDKVKKKMKKYRIFVATERCAETPWNRLFQDVQLCNEWRIGMLKNVFLVVRMGDWIDVFI